MDTKHIKLLSVVLVGLIVVVLVVIAAVLRSGSNDGAAQAPAAGAAPQPAPSASGLAAADKNGDGIVYQSGMHPWIVEDAPGQCPICGMDLMPVRVDGQEEGVVKIDPVTMQNMGVRTASVEVTPLQRGVRTTGRFEVDQQQTAVVSPKIGGWIEELYVNYEGARVGKGQALFEIYSPDLVSTQEEYLLALRNRERLAGTQAAADAERLVAAARRRLAFWDISEAQIRRLEETGEPTKTLTLYAPAAGTVTQTSVVEGQQVSAGQTLMTLTDLSRLWLMVDVYEQDLAWVGVGTTAVIDLPYDPGRVLRGRVDYLYDELDPALRTVKARVMLPNPGLKLKPGMYATVELVGEETAPRPVVPGEAVISTGSREVVILALGEGRFRPQEVTTGLASGGRVQVLSGLEGGESVVTSAQFLIDSEARLASAVSAMVGGHAGHGGAPAGPAATGKTEQERMRTDGTSEATTEREVHVVEIDITGAAFEPAQIRLQQGVPARLVFTRHTDETCASDVIIPELGVARTALPLHESVAIEVTPDEDGTFTFACGMDMIKGTLIVTS